MPKILKRLLLFFAILLLLQFSIIALLTGPDQIREVPEPAPYFASLLHLDSLPQATNLAQGQNPANQTMPLKWIWQEPDVSHLSPEAWEAWNQYRDECFETFEKMVLIPNKTKEMSKIDALEELFPYLFPTTKIRSNPFSAWREINAQTDLETAMFMLGNEIYTQAELGIYVEHEDWLSAGGVCAKESRFREPSEDGNWEAAVYYLRKAGIKGRLALLEYSFQRRLYSLLMSIMEKRNGNPDPNALP
jgi:hypothetical protein